MHCFAQDQWGSVTGSMYGPLFPLRVNPRAQLGVAKKPKIEIIFFFLLIWVKCLLLSTVSVVWNRKIGIFRQCTSPQESICKGMGVPEQWAEYTFIFAFLETEVLANSQSPVLGCFQLFRLKVVPGFKPGSIKAYFWYCLFMYQCFSAWASLWLDTLESSPKLSYRFSGFV